MKNKNAVNHLSHRFRRLINSIWSRTGWEMMRRRQGFTAWDLNGEWAKELIPLFNDWFETPVTDRLAELKAACRFAQAHPRFIVSVPYFGWSQASHLLETLSREIVAAAASQSQSVVNRRCNFLASLSDYHVDENTRITDSCIFSTPDEPPKMKAIRAAAYKARQVTHRDDGFRDIWEEHVVSIKLNGREIARTGCEQVGACARAHGRVWWKKMAGWNEMMSSSAWPTFETLPDVCVTYMEII